MLELGRRFDEMTEQLVAEKRNLTEANEALNVSLKSEKNAQKMAADSLNRAHAELETLKGMVGKNAELKVKLQAAERERDEAAKARDELERAMDTERLENARKLRKVAELAQLNYDRGTDYSYCSAKIDFKGFQEGQTFYDITGDSLGVAASLSDVKSEEGEEVDQPSRAEAEAYTAEGDDDTDEPPPPPPFTLMSDPPAESPLAEVVALAETSTVADVYALPSVVASDVGQSSDAAVAEDAAAVVGDGVVEA